ncbi:hypothetical protein SISSUDRAFT_753517 [Sistotremastrum suecicum HHB10207 ss-3]|uniref:Transcription factor domain-containing protein n=1 Tax=Sistotremastrum suecicum HHB10207 ss-3 TaxID=1314776 RepID=A0A166DEL4_9AGAM|nr:hypothetical protein SISSUDRAFT_753517 [Sistotremastrum suecicum HHB10207 ss-3]
MPFKVDAEQNLDDDGSFPNPDRISANKDHPSTRKRTKPYSRPNSADEELPQASGKIAYERKPSSIRKKGQRSIRPPVFDDSCPTSLDGCIRATNMDYIRQVETVPFDGALSQIIFAIKFGLEQPGHSDPLLIDLKSVGECDERAYSIIRTFFESPHLDVLQGFDVFLSDYSMEATLAHFGCSLFSASDFVKPSASQMAACMIILDIIDLVTHAWNTPYSGFFLQHARRCLHHAAWSRYEKSDREFPYALLLLGLRTFYRPAERSEIRPLLGVISELLHRQPQDNSPHNQYSGMNAGPTTQFLFDAFAIVCAISRTVDPSHENMEPNFLQHRFVEIKRLGTKPCPTKFSRKQFLFKARATLAYWHLHMWFIPETHYKSTPIREFRETRDDIRRLLAARGIVLQPSCLHY